MRSIRVFPHPHPTARTLGQAPASGHARRERHRLARLAATIAAACGVALTLAPASAQAQTWVGGTSADWGTAANWNPATVPNGVGTNATFDTSGVTTVSIANIIQVGGITFTANATSSYHITTGIFSSLTLSGTGITNNSGVMQYLTAATDAVSDNSTFTFKNSATAGSNITITVAGGQRDPAQGSGLIFTDTSSAGGAIIENQAGTASGANGGQTSFGASFRGAPTAGNAQIINDGAAVNGAFGGTTVFTIAASLGSATITTNGGTNGGLGGLAFFLGNIDGGTAQAITNGNGQFDIGYATNLKIGSIAGSGSYLLGSSTLTTGTNNLSTTVSGVIADGGQSGGTGGSLVKSGTGTLTLSGVNTYTGSTTVKSGILQIGTAGTAGAIDGGSAVSVNSGGTLKIVNAVVTGSNAFIANNITNGVGGTGTVNFSANQTNVLSGALTDGAAGQLALTQNGPGMVVLANTGNTYTGATTINGGSVQIGGAPLGPNVSGSISASSAISVGNDGTFAVFDMAGDTLANDISNGVGGTGTVRISSTNPITLSGKLTGSLGLAVSGTAILTNTHNSFFGATTVTGAGTLQIGTAAAGGSIGLGGVSVDGGSGIVLVNVQGNAMANNFTGGAASVSPGVVQVNSSSNIALLGVLSDGAASLSFRQTGTGTTTLLGNSTYTGQTLVEGGTLAVNGAIGNSNVGVDEGILTGTGTIGGTVSLLGGTLVPGSIAVPGTIHVGGLNLLSGSVNFRLGQTNGTNDLVDVTGNLGIGGHVNILSQVGFGIGTYSLINYGGALSVNNGGFSPVTGLPGYNATLVTTTPGVVQLAVSYLGTPQYWDGNGPANNGVVSGGTGTWDTTSTRWTDSGGVVNGKWLGGTAIFGNSSGTVTLSSPVSALALFFKVGGYTLAGTSALTMTGASPAINVVTAGEVATISAPVAGTSGLIAGGLGTLTLANSANTYTGGTTVVGGTLDIGTVGTAGSLGSGTVRVQNGGTLSLIKLNGTGLTNNITNGVGGVGTLQTTFLNNFALSGTLTDGGAGQLAVNITLGGTIILTNAANTYSGQTTVSQSTLQIGTTTAAGSIGSNSPVQVHMGGTLSLVNVAGNTFVNNISNSGGNLGTVVVNSANTMTLSGKITDIDTFGLGQITLTQNGTGTTILTNTDSYTGGTSVNAGTLQIGNGTAGNLTGTGAVTISNTGSVAMDQANGASMGANIILNGTGTAVKAIQAGNLILTGVISGTGAFNQNGTGLTELQAAETYTGATNVNAGILQVDTSLAAGSTVHIGASGALNGAGTIGGNVTLAGGTINLGATGGITGTLAVTGGNWNGAGTVGGIITSSSGAFTIGNGASLTATSGLNVTGGTLAGIGGTLLGSLTYTSGVSSVFGDVIANRGATPSSVTLNNAAATLTLTAANTYTGATTITAGTLDVEGSLAAGSTVNVGTGGTLTGLGTIGGNATIAGAGTINLGSTGQIAGNLTSTGGKWSGQGTVGGAVTVNSGAFILNGNLTTSSLTMAGGTLAGTGTLNNDLVYNSTASSTFGGVIAGTGAVTLNGPGGTLILSGANTSTGGLVVLNGTLQIGNGTAGNWTGGTAQVFSTLATNLANHSTFTLNIDVIGAVNAIQSGTNTLSGVISDTGSFNQNGTGTTVLNAVNTFSGATQVNAGTLQIGDGVTGNLSGTSGVTVAAGAHLALDMADGSTFSPGILLNGATATLQAIQATGTTLISGVISGTGIFNQTGAGTTELIAAETYTGATNVNAGTLQVDTSLAAASSVSIGSAGTLSGAGTINGKVTLAGGTIALSNGLINNTLTATGGNWTGNGTVTGAMTSSAGIFNVTGNLIAPAGLTITGGTLAGTGGSVTGNVSYLSSASSTFGSAIAGATSTLTVNKTGAVLILTGANTYGGATTVSAGTLQLGDGITAPTFGATAITVSGTSTLALNLPDASTLAKNVTLGAAGATVKAIQSGALTVTGTISGSGGFAQNGPGTTIFNAAETYTGATNINGGTLQVDSSLAAASTVNVAATGTLAGTGSIPGTVNVLAGGTLSAGDFTGPGTITVGKLVLNAGSNSSFRLDQAGVAGNGVNDLVQVTGNLTIAGNLNVSALANFGIGSYKLFTYGGTLTNTGFTAINGTAGFATSIATGTAHEVDLIVSGSAITQYWDGTGAANNGVISGGGGAWKSSGANWTTSDGATNAAWLGGTAVFGTIGGTVTLGTPLNAQGLIFGTTGYTLSGTSTLNLVGTALTAPTISVTNAGTTATISAPLTGTTGVAASGSGTLILANGANKYSGGTTITNGFVVIGTPAAAGSIGSGPIRVGNGGTLTLVNAQGNLLANNVTNGLGGTDSLIVASTLTNTLSGALTDGAAGQLALAQSGTGTTILTNAGNTFSGPTTITKGTLQIGTATAAGSLGAGTTVIVGTGGTLTLTKLAGNALGNGISNGLGATGTVVINSAGNDTLSGTLSNGIAGVLAVTHSGTGTTILTGNNTYTGATTVSAGTLQLGDGIHGALTGAGAVTVSGSGALALALPDGSTLGRNISLSAATATLKGFEAAGQTNTLSGVISGTGSFNQTGLGTTILTATNTYTGATNVATGTLENDGVIAAGSTIKVATGGTLAGSGSFLGNATLTGNGIINLQTGAAIGGTLTVTGGNWTGVGIVDGVVTSSAGNFNIVGTLAAPKGLALTGGTLTGTGTLAGSLTDTSSANTTFGAVISGATSKVTMNKAAATLTLTGASTYAGGTTVTAGTLQVGNGTTAGAALGTGVVTTAAAGTLTTNLASGETFSNSVTDTGHVVATGTANNYALAGVISGTGNLTKTGSNQVTVTAANTYKGGTVISGGTLVVNNTSGSGTGSGTVAVNNGGTLGGSGTITGATTLNSGGTIAPGAGSPGTGTILHASSLLWNGGSTLTFQLGVTADELALTGAFTKGAAGTYTIDITDAGIAQSTYTLLTFGSTTFAPSDFTLVLPVNYTGMLVATSTSLILENLTDPPAHGQGTSLIADNSGGSIPSETVHFDAHALPESGTTLIHPVAAPEPGSALLFAFGGTTLLAWRRRRRA